jgi:carbamate kinase
LSISDGLDLELAPIETVETSDSSKGLENSEVAVVEEDRSRDYRKSYSSPSPVDMVSTKPASKTVEASSRKSNKRRSLPPPRKYDPNS